MGTRRLTLLRHGKAQSIDACAEDFERALTRRGSIEAREMAARIVYRGLIPDLILVSPAERAWATAEIVAAAGLSQIASRLGPKPQPRELATAGIASAVWNAAAWESLQPESAISCDLDDPESLADLWA